MIKLIDQIGEMYNLTEEVRTEMGLKFIKTGIPSRIAIFIQNFNFSKHPDRFEAPDWLSKDIAQFLDITYPEYNILIRSTMFYILYTSTVESLSITLGRQVSRKISQN